MWSRYANYWEKSQVEKARAIYTRGVTVHLKRQPSFQVEFALFEEAHDAASHAEELFKKLLQKTPGHLQAIVSYANYFRRQKKQEEAKSLFAQSLLVLRDQPESLVFLTAAYAQFCARACGDVAAGREVLAEGRLKLPSDSSLSHAIIQFERRFGCMYKISIPVYQIWCFLTRDHDGCLVCNN